MVRNTNALNKGEPNTNTKYVLQDPMTGKVVAFYVVHKDQVPTMIWSFTHLLFFFWSKIWVKPYVFVNWSDNFCNE